MVHYCCAACGLRQEAPSVTSTSADLLLFQCGPVPASLGRRNTHLLLLGIQRFATHGARQAHGARSTEEFLLPKSSGVSATKTSLGLGIAILRLLLQPQFPIVLNVGLGLSEIVITVDVGRGGRGRGGR